MVLQDDVIFITGATSGFGKACAIACAKMGAKVIITGRRKERLAELGEILGKSAHVLELDIRNKQQVFEQIKNLPAEFSKITVLINNAGLALGLGPADEASLDDWETMVDTNIKGVLYATNAILPGMVQRNSGHIINMGSIAGTYPYPGGNVYGATKAFLKQFSLNLRADLLGKNIRVTNIEPGMVKTEFSEVRFKGDAQKAETVYAGMTPLSAEDIAETVLWCLSRPRHVNINSIEIMPVEQAFSAFAVSRKS